MYTQGLLPADALEYISKDVKITYDMFAGRCEHYGLRRGQCWFNHLTLEDQRKLGGSMWDPFFSDGWTNIIIALVYLLDPDEIATNHMKYLELFYGEGS